MPEIVMGSRDRRSSAAGALRPLLALLLAACGSSNGGGPSGTGGSPATGGSPGTGGVSATGGVTATGGAHATGGVTGTGGVTSTGGATATGGVVGTGGAHATGGVMGTGGTGAGGAAGAAGKAGSGGAGGAGGSTAGGGNSGSNATIVPDPSWACGMTKGIPAPTSGTLVFRAMIPVTATQDVGMTPYGHRRVLDLGAGTITGSKLTASAIKGGFDYELTLSNGVVEVEQIDVLKASDGTLIYLRTCGVAPAGSSEVRIVPSFEVANSSSLAWLNTGTFAGTRTVDSAGTMMEVDVYDVSNVTASGSSVSITVPSGATPQPWDCNTKTGSKGASVFTENVTLGSSESIGTSKNGNRNIIPITGGSVSGKVSGTVVYGGGDYQLVGGTTKLDARYVISANGDYVIVRNCGPIGSLVPLFETRADGPFAFLNSENYVSSDPGSGSGGVSITFYERQ
jgi:hypothetical protein